MSNEFQEYLAQYGDELQKLAIQIRKLIFEVMPELSEHIYPAMKVIRYGLDGNKMSGLVCYISPTKAGINLGFHHGTSLPDPEKLLEGTGKNLRHIKFKHIDEVNNSAIKDLLIAERTIAMRNR